MRTKVMQITPEIAKEMLEKNTKNRQVALKRVDMYADDMKRGEWQTNGEAICFNESGALVNGQHRLMAVIRSGCTVEMVVVFGVKDDVTLYDRGRNRSVSDALTLSGIFSTKTTAAMARIYMYEHAEAKTSVFSESRIKQFHIDHADSIAKVLDITKKNKRSGVNVRSAFFCTALLNAYEDGVPEETLRTFTEIVNTGFYERNDQIAAIVIRNDIIGGVIRNGGGHAVAVKNSYMVENAIKDFVAGYRRKKTYKNTTSKVYGKEKKDE